jgi:hypothetical protein
MCVSFSQLGVEERRVKKKSRGFGKARGEEGGAGAFGQVVAWLEGCRSAWSVLEQGTEK